MNKRSRHTPLTALVIGLLLLSCQGSGPTGPAGAQGEPGPSAAGFTVRLPNTASALPSNGSYGSTVTLTTGPGNSGPVTVSFPARLIINGTTRLQNNDLATRTMRCRLVLNPGAGQETVSAVFSTSVSTFAEATATLAGAADVDPGTYNVGMECATLLSNPNGRYADVSLTVIAVGR